MRWTNDPPKKEQVGQFWWMQIGDYPPEVVRIEKWGVSDTMARTVENVFRHAYIHNPTPTLAEIMSHVKWAGPIPLPEESCTK